MFAYDGGGNDGRLYVEDVFSSYTYIGTGASLPIVNGVNTPLGSLIWIKRRSAASHALYDTVRGVGKELVSDILNAEATVAQGVTSFDSSGFTLGTSTTVNNSGSNYVSWTFRKSANFFDVVTWTGNGSAGRQISHGLGVVPGMIIVKCTNTGSTEWSVHHRSVAATSILYLSRTNAATVSSAFNNASPTNSYFEVAAGSDVNSIGNTYVAYVFAHDTTSSGIIQCGSYTGNGSFTGPTVTLGWEPQYVLIKSTGLTGTGWKIYDSSRGMSLGNDEELEANSSAGPGSNTLINPNATGFQITTTGAGTNQSGVTYVYMAIRKGLMRAPTDATKVFEAVARTGTGATATISLSGIKTGPDTIITKRRNTTTAHNWQDRLRGTASQLTSDSNALESTSSVAVTAFNMDGATVGTISTVNTGASTYINYFLKQARGFHDVVSYVGDGTSNRQISHNLNAVPELMILKTTSQANNWFVYYGDNTKYILLNSTAAEVTSSTHWANTTPTSAVFTIGSSNNISSSSNIAYLFASILGVSKIGTYTGTGTTNQINCGFTAGARFVMIKRLDNTSDWYYWDTVRGIVSGIDSYLLMNSTATEVTASDYIDSYSPGFELSSTAPAALNASGGSFLFYAIA